MAAAAGDCRRDVETGGERSKRSRQQHYLPWLCGDLQGGARYCTQAAPVDALLNRSWRVEEVVGGGAGM